MFGWARRRFEGLVGREKKSILAPIRNAVDIEFFNNGGGIHKNSILATSLTGKCVAAPTGCAQDFRLANFPIFPPVHPPPHDSHHRSDATIKLFLDGA